MVGSQWTFVGQSQKLTSLYMRWSPTHHILVLDDVEGPGAKRALRERLARDGWKTNDWIKTRDDGYAAIWIKPREGDSVPPWISGGTETEAQADSG